MEQEAGENRWRECRICKTKSRRDSRQWLRPCRCVEPFHRYCIQQILLTYEAHNLSKTPVCPWCGAEYSVVPAKGLVITVLDKIANSWYPALCDVVVFITQNVVVDTAFVAYGILVLTRLYGFNEACEMLLDMDEPLVAISLCYSIPLAANVINIIPWEDLCLRTLRRWRRLPVMGAMTPQEGLVLPPDPTSFLEALVGGLTLPFFADFTGSLLFRTNFPVKRFLLGGAVFLVLRGVTYMYYEQLRFLHQRNLTVANYQRNGSSLNNVYL